MAKKTLNKVKEDIEKLHDYMNYDISELDFLVDSTLSLICNK
jgi:hypothetical protein